jgi:long-chain acyl-CoA synthetase
MILEHERIDQYDLSSVDFWFCAGDVLPLEVSNRWKEKFDKSIYQGYGASETCGGVSMSSVDLDNNPRSVGRILPLKKIKIVDPLLLESVELGKPGELIVHSEYMVIEYLNKPEEMRSSFIREDGLTWYRTSDIMSMDDRGNLYFIDRTVDTIKHKGYRVTASEMEAVLQEHPR